MSADYISFAIAQLLLADYEVYTLLSNRSVIALDFDTLQRGRILKVSVTDTGYVANISKDVLQYKFLIFAEVASQQCWLIPIEEIKGENSIRITDKQDMYKIFYNRLDKIEQIQNRKTITHQQVTQSIKESRIKVPDDVSIMDLIRKTDAKS
jgi:hypothetical protein